MHFFSIQFCNKVFFVFSLRKTLCYLHNLGRLVGDNDLQSMLAEAPGPLNFTVFLSIFGERILGELSICMKPILKLQFRCANVILHKLKFDFRARILLFLLVYVWQMLRASLQSRCIVSHKQIWNSNLLLIFETKEPTVKTPSKQVH